MDLNTTQVEVLEKRRYVRIPVDTFAVVANGERAAVRKGQKMAIRDATPVGLCLQTSQETLLASGDTVSVDWVVPEALSGEDAARRCRIRGKVVRVSAAKDSPGAYDVGIRLQGLIKEQIEAVENRGHRFRIGCILVLLAILISALKSRNIISFWFQPEFQIYSLAAAVFVLSRALLALRYKEPEDRGYMPAITVVIAAKNEAERIGEVIDHCYASRYPKDLLEIIAVDDGSTDTTWESLQTAQSRHPNLRNFRFDENRGKRHAMALGALRAKGKILIFIDSDSQVEPEGFYRIVQPFADKRVGAVAGHTNVIVEPDNFISKMEAVRYYVSQRVMKASESVFDSVTCCPGPFSAYRRDAMMNVLPEWEHQQFLGTKATFGDDRSLTNFILRNYRVVYHAGARCATYTPDRWMVFFRQQLRWKKSWFRETTVAVRYMWRKHPVAVLAYYISVVITLVSPLIGLRALLYLPLIWGTYGFVPYIAGLLLIYAFFGLIYTFYTRKKGWYYGMAFAMIYVLVLSVQNYYALATMTKNHWGTR